ncbi:MAG: glycosyltransferase [Anaerolineae bacterium]|nr:glycosyltransferase [Anaerolineae bacterium]
MAHNALPSYYQIADYCILYSGYEGLSHVLLESLSLGTPVIASDKGGNPEVVRHGENGLLVPYREVDALIRTLQEAQQPALRTWLRQQARLDATPFAWETLAQRTLALLESVADQR